MKLRASLFAILVSLVLALPAHAGENGEGLVGETNDKIITFFSLGVVLFFTLIAIFGSLLQGALEKRKERRKAAQLRARSGW